MVTIVPGILAKDVTSFEEQLKRVWGEVKRVQFDIIDGKFAPAETVGPEILMNVDTIVEFDAHLMVEKPEGWIEKCAVAGIAGVYGQVEKMEDPVKFIADAQMAGMRAGLAYDIETPLTKLSEYIDDLDGVLLMSVKAGDQGQEFDERVLSKIKEVRKMSKRVKIIIDGGLDEVAIKRCFAAEWSEEMAEEELDRSFLKMEFVVGSHLMSAQNVAEELLKLEHLSH